MTNTVVALYDDFAAAEAVIRDLAHSGFSKDALSLVASDEHGEARERTHYGETSGRAAETGEIGTLLAGLSTHRIPGIGPVLEAGPLAEKTADEDTGLIQALGEEGVPEEDAAYYSEGIRRGGTLVTVIVDEREAERAQDIMARQIPVDMARRVEEWRSSGWSHFDADAAPYSAERIDADRERHRTLGEDRETHIPIVEEQIQVGKREVERGRVHVHTRTVVEPVAERVSLREEQVRVERRAADRPASAEDLAQAFKEGTIEVAEHAEEPVVAKAAKVTGEVVIGKETTEREETVKDEVRRTEVEVDDDTTSSARRQPKK